MLIEILTNKIFLSCLLAVILAQLLKIIIKRIKERKYDPSLFFSTGGMPSGHSSVVSALATSVYLAEGLTSLFAVVCVVALITIYDSLTLRRAVGNHTSVLNAILRALKLHNKMVVREIAGHSMTQVLAGILLGFLVAMIMSMI